MFRHLHAHAMLAGVLFVAPLAAAQAADESTDREFARAFYAGFVEAREIDTRCSLLEPERRTKFADYLEYLRQDTVRDYDAALIVEAEEVGKRYARDPAYFDCGQAAMDRVEDRYERIGMLVGMDKWKRETPEGRAFAEKMSSVQEEAQQTTEDEVEPEISADLEADQKRTHLAMLKLNVQIIRIETRCRFLDESMRTRALMLHERYNRSLRNMIADPDAVTAVESAPDSETRCGDDQSGMIHRVAEQFDQIEALVELFEAIDAMTVGAKRRQEAAAAADLSVPMPPPPANRPKPLTKAQKQKAKDLDHYAHSLRTQRVETRCRFLPEETRTRLLRTETRFAEVLRSEIDDPAAVSAVDAAPDTDTGCGKSHRAQIAHAVDVLGLTEDLIEMMESKHVDDSR
jgi:hypothetical protein